MSYILKVKHPQLGQGKKLQIPGLGVFENGKAYEIKDHLVKRFETLRGDFVKHMHATHGVELANADGSPVQPPQEEEPANTPPEQEAENNTSPEGGEQ